MIEFVYELDANGDVREQCDFGAFNAPVTYDAATYDDVLKWPCSSDCKLLENKFADAATYPDYDGFSKWDCSINYENPPDSATPVNATRVVYEMTCNYLCGNRILDTSTSLESGAILTAGEECDLGGWAFSYIDNSGWYDTTNTNVAQADVENWIANSAEPTSNTALSLGCTIHCRACDKTAGNCAAKDFATVNNLGSTADQGTTFKFPLDGYS